MSRLDGSGQRALTVGSLGAGYAGYTRDADGRIELYYTAALAVAGANGQGAIFHVYREPLLGGSTEELFAFVGDPMNIEFAAANGSVSPAGTHLAYSDENGVSSYDLAQHTATSLLVDANNCVTFNPDACHGYYHPSWSPRGDWLLVEEIFYEGAQMIGVQPLNRSAGEREFAPRFDYEQGQWSPDGSRLCLVPANSYRAVLVINPELSLHNDLEAPLRAGLHLDPQVHVGASWCTWSGDGRLAMRYALSTDQRAGHVAVFDASLAFQTDVALPTASGSLFNAFSWLPDGAGFIIGHSPPDGAERESSMLLLDGTTRSLPFAAPDVLGVLPN